MNTHSEVVERIFYLLDEKNLSIQALVIKSENQSLTKKNLYDILIKIYPRYIYERISFQKT